VFLFILILSSIILSACARASATPTSIPTTPATPEIPTLALTDTPTSTPVPPVTRPQYTLDLQLNYANKSAYVNETIVYTNQSPDTLTSLVLAVEPTCTQSFNLGGLFVDGQVVGNYIFDVQNVQA
jgi:hypothetical protein